MAEELEGESSDDAMEVEPLEIGHGRAFNLDELLADMDAETEVDPFEKEPEQPDLPATPNDLDPDPDPALSSGESELGSDTQEAADDPLPGVGRGAPLAGSSSSSLTVAPATLFTPSAQEVSELVAQ
eukprot:CAMPEP_0185757360 /NCGR_PEP_ID=MMETSP1174-20130828/15839_1 /TAXON_ID=35687 /ORGANISM="Dictyocha speculum, Strain CCMP1381" /LENGTH=126 /DNA_ID=CAMNT_0028436743 /DNA_START=63 /DNA_END=440 /DNA_ORIENTATION=-